MQGDYVAKFYGYIKVKEPERFAIQFKKWLVRCVACCSRFLIPPEEIAENERSNARYSTLTLELELIQKYFLPGNKEDRFMTASEICEMLNAKLEGRMKVSREETGKALKKLGYIQYSNRGHQASDFPIKGYYINFQY